MVLRGAALPVVLLAGLLGGALALLAQHDPRFAGQANPVAVAKVSTIPADGPLLVGVQMVSGADRRLQRARYGNFGLAQGMALRQTPVYLVYDPKGTLHAFIGEDPLTGCPLDWSAPFATIPPTEIPATSFHDRCWGSLYDTYGQPTGGPSIFYLNALRAEIRDGDVYVYPDDIIVGACPGCARPGGSPPPTPTPPRP